MTTTEINKLSPLTQEYWDKKNADLEAGAAILPFEKQLANLLKTFHTGLEESVTAEVDRLKKLGLSESEAESLTLRKVTVETHKIQLSI